MECSVPVLRELPLTDAGRLRSGTRFLSVHNALMELLSNSIDADASEIYTSVNWTTQSFSICDNGFGIRREDFCKFGIVNCCGKEDSVQGWKSRGQSVKSIGQLGRVRIVSRPRGEYETWSKVIVNGKVVQSGLELPPRAQHGTSISVDGFLGKYPVRQKCALQLKTSRALLDLRDGFLRRLLPFPNIEFSFVNQEDGIVMLSLPKGRSYNRMMEQLFGDFMDSMVLIESSESGRSLHGQILRPGAMTNPASNLQLLYLNSRIVECASIQEMIRSLYTTAFQLVQEDRIQHPIKPVYLLKLEMTNDEFDIELEQDSAFLEFRKSHGVSDFIKRALLNAWNAHLPHAVLAKLASDNYKRQPSFEPAGEQENTKRKYSYVFSPVMSSRNRSLISVQRTPTEAAEDAEQFWLSSLDQVPKETSSIAELVTPMKATPTPVDPTSVEGSMMSQAEDSEMEYVSGPPFYKKIRRSVHINPSISMSTNTVFPISTPPVQKPSKFPTSSIVIPARRPRTHAKENQGWNNAQSRPDLQTSVQVGMHEVGDLWSDGAIQLIGCFDNKFILILKGKNVIAIDQHAADERVKLEHLEKQILDQLKTGFGHPLDQPLKTGLSPLEQEIFKTHEKHLASWGWKAEIFNSALSLTHQPRILDVCLNLFDLKLHLHELDSSHGVDSIPTPVHRVLRSKACRRAIKFGDVLSPIEQSTLLTDLAATQFWFICAHGRPTTCSLVV